MIHQLFPMSGALGILVMGLLFAFSNGFRDSSTIVATVVSTRALTPAKAFAWCAFFTFIGAFGLGSAVCSTIRHRFFSALDATNTSQLFLVLTATLAASLIWGAISWYRAWPTSNNHALIAGLCGSGWVAWGHN